MPKHKTTPPRLSVEQRYEVRDAFEQYIAATDDPTIAGFISSDPTALKYFISKNQMNTWPEMRLYVDRMLAKQEAYLVKLGSGGRAMPMAIFRLKQPQIGYTDRMEQDITTKGEKITFSNVVPRPTGKDKKRNRYGEMR